MFTSPERSSGSSERANDSNVRFLAGRAHLLAFVRGLVRDLDAADDMVQEIWLRFATAHRAGVVIEDDGKWCRGVARKLVLEYWRKQGRGKVIFDTELLDSVEEAFRESELSSDEAANRLTALRYCVARLPARARALLEGRYASRLSNDEIARESGLTPAAVKKQLYRLRRALADCVTRRLRRGGRGP